MEGRLKQCFYGDVAWTILTGWLPPGMFCFEQGG